MNTTLVIICVGATLYALARFSWKSDELKDSERENYELRKRLDESSRHITSLSGVNTEQAMELLACSAKQAESNRRNSELANEVDRLSKMVAELANEVDRLSKMVAEQGKELERLARVRGENGRFTKKS